jgi:hypothetical protein
MILWDELKVMVLESFVNPDFIACYVVSFRVVVNVDALDCILSNLENPTTSPNSDTLPCTKLSSNVELKAGSDLFRGWRVVVRI